MLNHCRPNLDAAIQSRRPRAILALGDTATRELTGEAGEARGVSHLGGYVLRGPNDIPVIPTFHPAFIRRGAAHLQGVFARNLQRAVQVAAGRDRDFQWGIDPEDRNTYGSFRYNLHPSLDDACSFALRVIGNSGAVISYDIETFESASLDEDARDGFTDTRLRLIQFSAESGEGIALPWEGDYRLIAGNILRSLNVKCGHNLWLFDNKVLEACGAREGLDLCPRGVIHDTLQMFHHWQPDLPAHLQFAAQFVSFPFPWKHLAATNLEFYGCVDVDATLRLYTFLRSALERDHIWDSADGIGGYVGQVAEVRPILAAMERRGLPVDNVERLKLDGEFDLAQQELDAELQARVPESVLGLEPRRGRKGDYSYGYLRDPQDTTGLVRRTFTEAATGDSGEPGTRTVSRWCRVIPFNANSWQQLLAYMDARGHKRPKSREQDDEGNDKDTTDKKSLVRLAHRTGDNFYLKVIEYRELSKMRGTYIEGFAPHPDGRVHTTFTFDTGIGQLSCCAPWTQVMTEYGPYPITEVEVGWCVRTHERRWRKVTAKWEYDPQPMYSVHFSNGEVLTCTPSHKLLIFDHVHQQEVVDQRERKRSAKALSEQGGTHRYLHLSEVGTIDPHSDLGAVPQNVIGGVFSIEKAALLAVEDGDQEPTIRQAWIRDRELDRDCRRWVRVSDLLGRRPESVRTSASDGTGAGDQGEGLANEDGDTPHQRGHEEQRYRQSGIGYECWAQICTLPSADGSSLITIEKIVPVGCFPVHDITVEEDESYAACNVFSHNSRNPNIQNYPKHGRLAKAVRKMIAAEPGHLLAEWDYKSCHVLTLGLLAEDANYIRCARIDMHSIVTGHKLGLWDARELLRDHDDAYIKAKCQWLKANPEWKHIRDARMKHAILGIGNGLKAKGLFEKHMEDFSGQKEAQQFLDVVEYLFPGVFAWQKRIQQRAHDQQFLRTEYGHIRRFYEVFRWDYKKQAYGHGDQAEEAISYWLSNIAFGYIREHLKELARLGLDEKYGLCNNVHDSLVFHLREELLEEHVREVYPVLVAPSRVLRHPVIAPEGLWIDAELNVGRNWAEMHEVSVKPKEVPREMAVDALPR